MDPKFKNGEGPSNEVEVAIATDWDYISYSHIQWIFKNGEGPSNEVEVATDWDYTNYSNFHFPR